jgi:phage shock protein PspC (stress-responsive transcriptional regulator)
MENTTPTTTIGDRVGRLTRSANDKVVAGVCGGLAHHFSIDPALVRLAFIVFAFAGGASIPVYVVLWIVMPLDDGSAVATVVNARAHETLALVLVAIGGIWLLANLGVFRFIDWQFGWPLALIAIGIALLARRVRP